MVDRVFDNGLQRNLVAQVVQALLLHVEGIGKLILIAVGLDLQIALGMLQLAADGDKLVAAADADAEQPRQRIDHLDGLGISPLLAHPCDGVKRIIEEVRVDLRLQGAQLRLAQVDLLGTHLLHEALDLHDHLPERI